MGGVLMGLAITELPIIEETISAAPASFLTDLHPLLLAAGWTAAVYLTGHIYACESPQSLAVQVRVWDPSDPLYPSCVAFQWVSSVPPYPAGLIHHLYLNADYTFDVWANCCCLFVARTGVVFSDGILGFHPVAVCGGVPWATGLTAPTPECEAQSPAAAEGTTELWFSGGDDIGPAAGDVMLESFRSGHYCNRYTFCRNGVLMTAENAIEADALQLGILRPTGYYSDNSNSLLPGGLVFTDSVPLAVEPLLWLKGTIHGQLWDACLLSVPMTLGAAETIYETEFDRTTEWKNHSRGTTYRPDDGSLFSLLLLTGISGGGGTVVENIAY
jgi:hypothetical protein